MVAIVRRRSGALLTVSPEPLNRDLSAALIAGVPIHPENPRSPNCYIGVEPEDVSALEGKDPREWRKTTKFVKCLFAQAGGTGNGATPWQGRLSYPSPAHRLCCLRSDRTFNMRNTPGPLSSPRTVASTVLRWASFVAIALFTPVLVCASPLAVQLILPTTGVVEFLAMVTTFLVCMITAVNLARAPDEDELSYSIIWRFWRTFGVQSLLLLGSILAASALIEREERRNLLGVDAGVDVDITLDGEMLGSVRAGHSQTFEVPAGRHHVRAEGNGTSDEVEIEVPQYYYRAVFRAGNPPPLALVSFAYGDCSTYPPNTHWNGLPIDKPGIVPLPDQLLLEVDIDPSIDRLFPATLDTFEDECGILLTRLCHHQPPDDPGCANLTKR